MTLAQNTQTILLDEPTTYLDMTHQIEILDLLLELNEREQRTIVMVLHDINLACRYAYQIVAVKDDAVLIRSLMTVKASLMLFDLFNGHECP